MIRVAVAIGAAALLAYAAGFAFLRWSRGRDIGAHPVIRTTVFDAGTVDALACSAFLPALWLDSQLTGRPTIAMLAHGGARIVVDRRFVLGDR